MSRYTRHLLTRAIATVAIAVVVFVAIAAAPRSDDPTITALEERILAGQLATLALLVAIAVAAATIRARRARSTPDAIATDFHVLDWPASAVGALLNVARSRRPIDSPVVVAAVLELALRGRYRLFPAQGDIPGFDVDLALVHGDDSRPIPIVDRSAARLADAALHAFPADTTAGIPLGRFGQFVASGDSLPTVAFDALRVFELDLVAWLERAELLGTRLRTQTIGGRVVMLLAGASIVAATAGALVGDGASDWTAPLVLMSLMLFAAGWFIRVVSASPVNRGLSPTGRALAARWRAEVAQLPDLRLEDVTMAQIDRSLTHQAVAGRATELALGARIDDPWRQVVLALGPRAWWPALRHWLLLRGDDELDGAAERMRDAPTPSPSRP